LPLAADSRAARHGRRARCRRRRRRGRSSLTRCALARRGLRRRGAKPRSPRRAPRTRADRAGRDPRARDTPWLDKTLHHRAQLEGFDLHAAVSIPSHARDRLEQLLRYCARPAISHDRLQLLRDGRVELKLKSPRFDGTSHLILTTDELIERLIAVIPRPRKNLILYTGALAQLQVTRASHSVRPLLGREHRARLPCEPRSTSRCTSRRKRSRSSQARQLQQRMGVANWHGPHPRVPTHPDAVAVTVARLATGAGGLTLRRTGFAPAGQRTRFHEVIASSIPPRPASPGRTMRPIRQRQAHGSRCAACARRTPLRSSNSCAIALVPLDLGGSASEASR
jgi:hypothetical protein